MGRAVSTRKGGRFYGYRVHLATCSRTGLPLAWEVASRRVNESNFALPLIHKLRAGGIPSRDLRDG
jgi:Transposase DDE domain